MPPQEQTPFQYTPDTGQSAPVQAEPAPVPAGTATPEEVTGTNEREEQYVSWTASEYMEHPHGSGWYLALILATVAFTAVVYLLTRDLITVSVIAIVLVIVGVFAGRKPRVINYEVSDHGVQIATKFYPYSTFRSFGVTQEGILHSIVLMPIKRYMPPISAYFEEKDVDDILDLVGTYLPFEQHQQDMVERLTRRIRL